MKDRRLVITGIGTVSPVGNTREDTWNNLLSGKSGAGQITRFDTEGWPVTIAAEVKGFDPLNFMEKREVRRTDRFIHYAIAATEEAMADSGLVIDDTNAPRVGVYIGSGIGGLQIIEDQKEKMVTAETPWKKISPFFIPSLIVNMASGMVSIRHGAKGPNSATCTACSSSCHSIGDSFKIIQRGDADAMICGGTEGVITPMGIGGFAAARALSTRNDDPETASRPFDAERDGFLMGEGSGMLILEELEIAKKRGAKIYGEVVGYGMSGDAYHITTPSADGDGPMRVMQNAMNDGGIQPEEVNYINAHGTSTPAGDIVETLAMRRAFGDHADKIAVNSTKSMTGHLLGAAGGIESAVTALSVYHQKVHPTINHVNPDPKCDLDIVAEGQREVEINYALTNSFGFGGTNGAILMKRFSE
jgi:3-oxoacyl-[acyl-carrier-protein] synthase II